MRDMSEPKREEAAKWAAQQRLRLERLQAERYAKIRDTLDLAANDCQQDKVDDGNSRHS